MMGIAQIKEKYPEFSVEETIIENEITKGRSKMYILTLPVNYNKVNIYSEEECHQINQKMNNIIGDIFEGDLHNTYVSAEKDMPNIRLVIIDFNNLYTIQLLA